MGMLSTRLTIFPFTGLEGSLKDLICMITIITTPNEGTSMERNSSFRDL